MSENKSIQQKTLKLASEIQNMTNYKSLYSDIQKLTCSPCIKTDDFKLTLEQTLKTNGLETQLRNNVYHWVRSSNSSYNLKVEHPLTDWFSHLDKVQVQWERRIYKSINSMCVDLDVSLARLRPVNDKEEIVEKWNVLSTYDIDLGQYKPVYAPKDFLEVLLTLYPPNEEIDSTSHWEFTHIPLVVKSLSQLRILYVELAQGEAILGVNPYMASSASYPTLEAERTALGEKVLSANHAPVAQEFLKRGSPRCLRSKLWMQILGSEVKQNHRLHFEKLKNLVFQYDLMVDKIIIKDIQLTASNDDQYFVFEDVLYQVMLCFSRDGEVLSALKDKPGHAMQVPLKHKSSNTTNTVLFPPSGVIPFHGFSMFAAPFCYLYDDPILLYFTFRAFYLRYWHRLHCVSGHPQGILALCLLYERLLQTHEPNLWSHIKQNNIQPIRLVFKWLMRAFSGHLPPEQLLYLWDLILAYDSLEILPLLAVCIVIFRKENLLQVDTLPNMENILNDLSSVIVMPLLQLSLLKD